jgi:arsenical pump membrane protein
MRITRPPLPLVAAGLAVVALATRAIVGGADPWAPLTSSAPLVPALAFLATGVPLAILLDRLGFFTAAAEAVARLGNARRGLWVAAAVTTAVLNLDTTVVLLTPLYVRLARRTGQDPFALACIPLLLANLASAALPVSNLTTLIAADTWDLGAGAMATHLGLPTVAACVAGWFAYRRAFPPAPGDGDGDGDERDGRDGRAAVDPGEIDRRALAEGGAVVAAVLVGFIMGPTVGVAPWMVALAADAVLVVRTRHLPLRAVPVGSMVLVVALAVVTAAVLPAGLGGHLTGAGPGAALLAAVAGTAAANTVNNLPALLAGLHGTVGPTSAGWGWLLGVSLGPVLWPLGSLANLLWWRSAGEQGVEVSARDLVRVGVRVGGPALLAAGLALAAVQALLPA